MSESSKPGLRPRRADPRNPVSVRLWLLAALAFVAAFLAVRQYTSQPTRVRMANYSWNLSTLDGKPAPLSMFKGRPIFLNIWATWCPPCIEEMPSIGRLASNPDLAGKVDFVCVATDEHVEDVRKYVARTAPPMTILHATTEPPPVFLTRGIPATFVIAPDGRIVREVLHGDEWDRPDVVKLLRELAVEATR